MKIKVYLKSGVTIDFDYTLMLDEVFNDEVEALKTFDDPFVSSVVLDDGNKEVAFKTSQIAAYEVIR